MTSSIEQAEMADDPPAQPPTQIQSQYQAAIALYLHEDNLNWTKIRAFLLGNGVLLAAYHPEIQSWGLHSTVIPLVASAFNSIFLFALYNGRAHISERRQTLEKLDRALFAFSGVRGYKILPRRVTTINSIIFVGRLTSVLWFAMLVWKIYSLFICNGAPT